MSDNNTAWSNATFTITTKGDITFNITMPALSCERANVDVLDLFDGTHKMIVAKDIEKVGEGTLLV